MQNFMVVAASKLSIVALSCSYLKAQTGQPFLLQRQEQRVCLLSQCSTEQFLFTVVLIEVNQQKIENHQTGRKMEKKHDLTSKICQYLDRHLTFPLLEFLCEKEVCVQYICEWQCNNVQFLRLIAYFVYACRRHIDTLPISI